jgi:hypothetical protein
MVVDNGFPAMGSKYLKYNSSIRITNKNHTLIEDEQ